MPELIVQGIQRRDETAHAQKQEGKANDAVCALPFETRYPDCDGKANAYEQRRERSNPDDAAKEPFEVRRRNIVGCALCCGCRCHEEEECR